MYATWKRWVMATISPKLAARSAILVPSTRPLISSCSTWLMSTGRLPSCPRSGQCEVAAGDVAVRQRLGRAVLDLEDTHRPVGEDVLVGVHLDLPGRGALAVDAEELGLLQQRGLQLLTVVRVAALGDDPLHELPEDEGRLVVVGREVVRHLLVLVVEGSDEVPAPVAARVVVEVVAGEEVAVEGRTGDVHRGGGEVRAHDGPLQAGRRVLLHERRRVTAVERGEDHIGLDVAQLGHRGREVATAALTGLVLNDLDLGPGGAELADRAAEVVLERLAEVPEVAVHQDDRLGAGHLLGDVLQRDREGVVRRKGTRPPDVRLALEERGGAATRVDAEDLGLCERPDHAADVEDVAGEDAADPGRGELAHGVGPGGGRGGDVPRLELEVRAAGLLDLLGGELHALEALLAVERLEGAQQQGRPEGDREALSRRRAAPAEGLADEVGVDLVGGCGVGRGICRFGAGGQSQRSSRSAGQLQEPTASEYAVSQDGPSQAVDGLTPHVLLQEPATAVVWCVRSVIRPTVRSGLCQTSQHAVNATPRAKFSASENGLVTALLAEARP